MKHRKRRLSFFFVWEDKDPRILNDEQSWAPSNLPSNIVLKDQPGHKKYNSTVIFDHKDRKQWKSTEL